MKGYSTLSAGVHTLPFAIVAAVSTPLAAILALKIGTRVVVTTGLVLMAGGLVVAAFNSEATTSYWGPIIVAMVLLALGLSSITAPTTEAVMGSVPDEQRGAAAGVNNTTRELGGTLGVAVFGSIFASSYAPRIISAFRPLPIPAGPKTEAHQSMAAALVVVHRAPKAARPALESVAFNAFHSGLWAACIAGAAVAVAGAVACVRAAARPGAPVAAETPEPRTRRRRRRTSGQPCGELELVDDITTQRHNDAALAPCGTVGTTDRLREQQPGVPHAGDDRARRPLHVAGRRHRLEP